MTMLSDGTCRYRLTVRGDCASLLASIPWVREVESSHDGQTRAIVAVCDDSAFWGLLDQLQEFALHIVGLHELTGPSG
jgi:hypothetical protein